MAGGFQNNAFQTDDAFQPQSGAPPRIQPGSLVMALVGASRNVAFIGPLGADLSEGPQPSRTNVQLAHDGRLIVEFD